MIYVVKAGDTLYRIAEEYGTSVNELAYVNQLWRQNDLVVGQSLLIPENMDRSGQRDMYVSGYAYPFVQEPVLSESISVLNDLLVFSYGFTFDGDLIPPITDDLWMIEFSWNHGVKPILVLTPFAETGAFNNMLVKTVVENLEVQERLIQNIKVRT